MAHTSTVFPRTLRSIAAVATAAGLVTATAAPAQAGIFDSLFSFSSGSSESSGGTGAQGGNKSSSSGGGATTTAGKGPGQARTEADIPQWTTPLSGVPAALEGVQSNGQYTSSDPIDWGWLSSAPILQPGAKIYRQGENTIELSCSAGWIMNNGKSDFLATAGHCGAPINSAQQDYTFALARDNATGPDKKLPSQLTPFGTNVEAKFSNSTEDFALIHLNTAFTAKRSEQGAKLYTNNVIERGILSGLTQVDRPLSLNLLKKDETWLCHVGYKTGLSCGTYQGRTRGGMITFKGTVDRGDSGGPVFAIDKNHIYPVGILSSAERTDKTIRFIQAQPVISVMTTKTNLYWGEMPEPLHK